jgi:MoaA/NifB/PqqE/SkfB family radical SAM enzyme
MPLSFDLEITARCDNACRHCYINLPAGDLEAQRNELSVAKIGDITNQAIGLGAFIPHIAYLWACIGESTL